MQRMVTPVPAAQKLDYVQLADQRRAQRRNHLESIDTDLDRYCRSLPGKNVVGKDGEGAPAITKEPHILKMAYQENGLVSIRFGLKFSRRGRRVIEGEKVGIQTTDIYRAVRKARHVWEGYEADIKKREGLLRKTEIIQFHFKCRGKGYLDNDFEKRIASLGRIFKKVKKYTSGLNEEGKARFEEAKAMLIASEHAENRSEKMRILFNACAKLVAFGNDFGIWRDEEVVYMKMFNQLRERALRSERDRRLGHSLCKWEGALCEKQKWAVMNVWKKDAQFAKVMDELSEKLQWGEKKRARWLVAGIEKLAKASGKGCAHFVVHLPTANGKKHWIDEGMDSLNLAKEIELLGKGERFSAGMLGETYWIKAAVLISAKKLAEKGYDDGWKGKYSIVQNMNEAYVILRDAPEEKWCEALKSASKEVELGARMLLVDNPFYAAQQLAEGPETYLTLEKKKNASILKYVQEGAKLVGRGNPGRAAYCFGEAQKLLGGGR
jgi:hypothetical protein